ncbi:MAG: hypothetical protein K0Q66_741 [Chitinophagaceae bacterium]|nr:hypothetical protein [Chitinophagaceae bacterium]
MKVLLALAAFMLALAVTAQPYNRALGVKFPVGTGITYKKFISEKSALEFQAVYARESFRTAGLYEFHFPFTKAEGLTWYVGPGVHVAFYKSEYQKTYSSKMDLGIDGVLGLDYKFAALPINLSLDWQPSFSFTGNSGAQAAYGGVALRYVF